MAEVRLKTISYKPNGDKPGENSGFDPLYGGEGDNLIPFPRDRIVPWWIDEDETKREGIVSHLAQMSSAHHLDDRWFGLWEDLDGQGIVPFGIKTLTDFKNWFHKQELDVEMFSRGGIASLIRAKRRYEF